MKIKIYQINLDRDEEGVCFECLEWLRRSGIPVRREIYDLVYEGEVPDNATLEDIYRMFNFHLPLDYFGRRLSVSDGWIPRKDCFSATLSAGRKSNGTRHYPESEAMCEMLKAVGHEIYMQIKEAKEKGEK